MKRLQKYCLNKKTQFCFLNEEPGEGGDNLPEDPRTLAAAKLKLIATLNPELQDPINILIPYLEEIDIEYKPYVGEIPPWMLIVRILQFEIRALTEEIAAAEQISQQSFMQINLPQALLMILETKAMNERLRNVFDEE